MYIYIYIYRERERERDSLTVAVLIQGAPEAPNKPQGPKRPKKDPKRTPKQPPRGLKTAFQEPPIQASWGPGLVRRRSENLYIYIYICIL